MFVSVTCNLIPGIDLVYWDFRDFFLLVVLLLILPFRLNRDSSRDFWPNTSTVKVEEFNLHLQLEVLLYSNIEYYSY